jgi:hypothetical protein
MKAEPLIKRPPKSLPSVRLAPSWTVWREVYQA